jgi:hypothetical protein
MPLRRMIVVLALSFLLSQQLLTQTPSQAPTSGSSETQTSGTPNHRPAKPGCTDNGSYVNSKGQTVKRPENCTTVSTDIRNVPLLTTLEVSPFLSK